MRRLGFRDFGAMWMCMKICKGIHGFLWSGNDITFYMVYGGLYDYTRLYKYKISKG